MLDDGTEPDETQETLTRAALREHAIVLCCAHSVVELVEEVARNLRGLSFEVEVVTGAEARTALLGHGTDANRPTIYVVCVQGTLKEQVLKPLRQALATHGGPNAHLFAAVLDLSLPLAMVGQIRRFAEALGRPKKRKDGLGERRQWREQLGVATERVATRSYRAIESLQRGDTGSSPAVDAVRRTGPQAVIGSARPAPVGATDKYRAVTGSVPTVPEDEDESDTETTVRRPRRPRAPKVRVKAVPTRGARPADEPAPAVTGDTVVARAPAADDDPPRDTVIITPPPRLTEVPTRPAAAPARDMDDVVVAPFAATRSRSVLPFVGAALVVVAGGVGLWWWMAERAAAHAERVARSGPTSRDDRVREAAVAAAAESPDTTETKSADDAAMKATATPTVVAPVDAPRDPVPADVAAAGSIVAAPNGTPPTDAVAPAVPAAPSDSPTTSGAAAPAAPVPVEATPTVEATPAPDDDDDAPVAETTNGAPPAVLPALADALASRRLRATDRLYVTTERTASASWATARATCEAFSIGGVDDFRLPHRRELQMIDIAGFLRDGPHWSRTSADDDPTSAYVLHASTGQLVVWAKDEPAAVVCVRAR